MNAKSDCALGLPVVVHARGECPDAAIEQQVLALFSHLRQGRPRTHLRGCLFKVAHNLALRPRRRRRGTDVIHVDAHVDSSPDPEVGLALMEHARRVQSVFRALSARDQQCLFLRAEGLPYREIATTLGISLGSVAKSLARAMTRFVNAEHG